MPDKYTDAGGMPKMQTFSLSLERRERERDTLSGRGTEKERDWREGVVGERYRDKRESGR